MLTKTGNSNAESTDVTVEIDPVLSLRLSKDEINLNPNPEPSGTFAYDTLSAIVDTNNKTGYTLTMNSETEEAALAQEDGETKIDSLANEVTVTSENQSNFTMNRWGYALTDTLTDSETSFLKIPALSTPDTIKTSDAPVSDDTTPVTLATKVDTSLPSGTYKNTLVFSATANFVPPTPPKNTSALTQALADVDAEFIEALDGTNYYTMQSMTSSICNATQTPGKEETDVPEATLIDTRDSELYTVRKLADGNCWMSQNLRLKLTANTPLTSADTDVASNFTPTLSTQPTSENTTSWGAYDNASDVNKSRSYDTGNTEYGTYYNWYTATAGTGLYNTVTSATGSICPKGWQLPLNDGAKSYYNLITTTYGLASNTEGSTKLQSAPLSFPLSGSYRYSGSVVGQGSYGYFWSATSHRVAYLAYGLTFSSSSISPQFYDGNKTNGFTVRCVARGEQQTINFNSSEADSGIASASTDLGDNINLSYYSSLFKKDGYTLKEWRDQSGNTYDATNTSVNVNPGNNKTITLTAIWEPIQFFPPSLTTMQGMTADICNSVTTPRKNATTIVTSQAAYTDINTQVPSVTLKDTRDNNTYTVRKLADGNCWMTQDLRIVGPRTLTSADSDVSSDYTLPAPQTSGFTNTSNNNQVGAVNPSYGNGAYYSWYAATAGTGTSSVASGDTPSSVCPKGWRLPQNTGSKSYYNLIATTYGYDYRDSEQLTAQPLQFAYGGWYDSNSFSYGGRYGFYWSSAAYSSTIAHNLHFSPFSMSGMDPQYSSSKAYGLSVRCVAR